LATFVISIWLPFTIKSFGMNRGDDGARTPDLCRDRTIRIRNPLILKGAYDSESAQKHPCLMLQRTDRTPRWSEKAEAKIKEMVSARINDE
jgi:hypothetical protein